MTSLHASLEALHAPWRVYDECDHEHTDEDILAGKAYNIPEIGYTCDLMYVICRECCTDGPSGYEEQTEGCATYHTHTKDPDQRCHTIALLAAHRGTVSACPEPPE